MKTLVVDAVHRRSGSRRTLGSCARRRTARTWRASWTRPSSTWTPTVRRLSCTCARWRPSGERSGARTSSSTSSVAQCTLHCMSHCLPSLRLITPNCSSRRRAIYPLADTCFYRATLCVSAVFAVARCPSVCLSRWWIVSTRLYCQILDRPSSPTTLVFLTPCADTQFQGEPFSRDAK